MARGPNAQIAVSMYDALRVKHGWDAANAWKGIATLLLSCEIWQSGWKPFHNCVVYRESNDFKLTRGGKPNGTIVKALNLTAFLGQELGISGPVCPALGLYWKNLAIASSQPNNLVGHAFRSIVMEILKEYGDKGISYEEEVDPRTEFPGYAFQTRSKDPRIDIVARRGSQTVALISTRWRFRHDRVDVIDEAHAYVPAARRAFPKSAFYAMVGEFSAARLSKILENAPPQAPNGIISACVHFQPTLLSKGLNENGRVTHLRSLEWLIAQTHKW